MANYASLKNLKDFYNNLKSVFVKQEKGKGLSTNDYTSDEKAKLEGIEAGATKTVIDTEMDVNSTNPVQNKVVQAALDGKAPIADPTFTGYPKAPTAPKDTNDEQVATTAFVHDVVEASIDAAQALRYKGTIGVLYDDDGTTEKASGTIKVLPDTHEVGDLYVVQYGGTYAGQVCEPGDMIIGMDGTNWTVVQTNIDGAVTGPKGAVDAHVAVYDGTTGKVIKDSGLTIGASVPADAKFTDTTYDTMKGATTGADGEGGLVPVPTTGEANRYLRSDGTWAVPPDENTEYDPVTDTTNGLMTPTMYSKLKAVESSATADSAITDEDIAAIFEESSSSSSSSSSTSGE